MSVDQFIEKTLAIGMPETVIVCYFDRERQREGQTQAYSYETAVAKMEAMRKNNPEWDIWLDVPSPAKETK